MTHLIKSATRMLLVLATLGLTAGMAVALPSSLPSSDRLDFVVTRNGEAIGTHRYRFTRDGDRVKVDIQTEIDFKVLFVPLYRFRHVSQEVWDGDKLASLKSSTNDNGEPVRLEVKAVDEVLAVKGGETVEKVDAKAVPASLWNVVSVKRNKMVGTVDGAILKTQATHLGEDVVKVGGQSIATEHYRVTGDYQRELWYDRTDGTLVRVRFTASDGSQVEYVRAARGAKPLG